jgi:hypothetical protein
VNTDKDKTTSETKAWGIVCEFAKLAKGRTPELKRLARVWLASGAKEENLDAEGETGLAVVRLAVANDRLRESKGKRVSTLNGVTELLPVLCGDDFEQIRMAVLILGDWPNEWPALKTSLEVLKTRWGVPPKSDTPSPEELKEACREGIQEGLTAAHAKAPTAPIQTAPTPSETHVNKPRQKKRRRKGHKGGKQPTVDKDTLDKAIKEVRERRNNTGRDSAVLGVRAACDRVCEAMKLTIQGPALERHYLRKYPKERRKKTVRPM